VACLGLAGPRALAVSGSASAVAVPAVSGIGGGWGKVEAVPGYGALKAVHGPGASPARDGGIVCG
jgi:hypothetical protein